MADDKADDKAWWARPLTDTLKKSADELFGQPEIMRRLLRGEDDTTAPTESESKDASSATTTATPWWVWAVAAYLVMGGRG